MFGGVFTKALSAMRHTGPSSFLLGLLSRTKFDYAKEVGTGIDSSVVMAPIQWIQRAFPEARLRVMTRRKEEIEEVESHALVELITNPNSAYSGVHLWAATLFSYLTAGNAYWLKVKTLSGRVVELWYVPHWLLTAKWPADGSQYISHYEYKPTGAETMRLEPDDIVHFRHGIDPRNTRLGLSPLHGVIREIFMDLEASNFVASLLRNLGIPGVVISPDADVTVDPDDAKAVKAWFKEEFGGDRRGAPLVMAMKTKVQQYGFNPQQMDLSVTRDVAEERVCASLGIPAAVVGFGAGLQQTKVGATMNELRRLAWINGVIPLHRAFAIELQRSLLPDFERDSATISVEFDISEVTALEEDLNRRAERLNVGVQGGWITVGSARRQMGEDVTDADDIYLRRMTVIEVPVGESAPVAPPSSDDNGKVVPILGRKTHTPAERRATGNPKRKPTQGQARFVALLARQQRVLSEAFEKRLASFFKGVGTSIAAAALPILEEAFKASPDDVILAGRILEEAGMGTQEVVFREMYEAHYLTVAEMSGEAAELVGLATDLPDPVARAVMAAGGRRAGLVDLTTKARGSIFNALTEGRAAGEGADAMARRIRAEVPKGPWSSSGTRARVIARTETAFAQNTSTIERSRDAGIEMAIVFDNRTGFDDDICPQLDGIEVTLAEAEALAADEHPNGTRSFSPLVQEDQ